MNKQLVNLIGGAAAAAILVLGIVVCALPMFSTANSTMADADSVAAQNRTQQAVLDGLTTQAGQLSEIQREVSRLRQGIPETEQLEDVVELAAQAALAYGGVLRSVTPGETAAFAPRTAEVVQAELSAEGATAPEASETTEEGTAPEAETETGAPAPAEEPVADASGPQQVAVVVEVDARDVATATLILDALRAGPRLVAVTQANVQTEEDAVTLTATLLAFYRP
jgi:TolA-binding protein